MNTANNAPAEDQTDIDAAVEDQAPAPQPDPGPVDQTDQLPDEFTLEDLEGLTKSEQEAILKSQDDERTETEAAAPEPVQEPEPPVKQPDLAPKVDMEQVKADLDKIGLERDDLWTKFDDGEISQDDFKAQLTAIDKREIAVEASSKAFELIDTSATEAADKTWFDAVGGYMDKFPELRTDAHIAGFDASLRAVETSQPNLSDSEKIATAHRNYGAYAHSIGTPLTQAPSAPGKASNKLPDPGPRPDLPPTLAKTPAADIQSQNDGRFAQIDRLTESGDVYASEASVAAMSPAEYDKYLAEV
jgi:hypothetical protein